MKIKRDQNDLCISLEESVEHNSKFMVLCISPGQCHGHMPVSSIIGAKRKCAK